MNCRFSFKHMKASEAVTEYARSKILPKVEKFSTKPIDIHFVFSVEGHLAKQIVHCSLKGGDGFNSQVEAECEDMYGSIDLLVDKIDSVLKKQKEKLKQHKFTSSIRLLKTEDVISEEDCDSIPVDASDLLKYERAKSSHG